MREYRGFMVDSARWQRFEHRRDDVVIATPAKCGTTWMQTIVAMLVFNRVALDKPVGQISRWLDSQLQSEEAVFGLYEAQQHRCFIKTHLALDGSFSP